MWSFFKFLTKKSISINAKRAVFSTILCKFTSFRTSTKKNQNVTLRQKKKVELWKCSNLWNKFSSEIEIIFILQSDDIFIHYAFVTESEGMIQMICYDGRLNFKCSSLTWISIKSKIQCENSRDENKTKLQLICWKYSMYRFRCVVFVYSRFNLTWLRNTKNAIYKTNTTETATCSKRLKTR